MLRGAIKTTARRQQSFDKVTGQPDREEKGNHPVFKIEQRSGP